MAFNPAYAAKDPYYYPAPCKPGDYTSIADYCRTRGAPLPRVATTGQNCAIASTGARICAQVISTTETDRTGRTTRTWYQPSTGYTATECLANCGSGTGFFGLGGGAADLARVVSLPAVLAAVSLVAPQFTAVASAGGTLADLVRRKQEGMALNIGQLLSGIGGAIGGIQGGVVSPYTSTIGGLLQAGGQIASAFVPQPSTTPVIYQTPQVVPVSAGGVVARQAMASAGTGMLAGAGGLALRQYAREIAAKASSTLGRFLSTAGLVTLARKMAKFFTSPEAIAVYLGITVGELYTVYTYEAARKHRRMNPANAKALRRAARRIKSFHRMCGTVDLLKSRGRRTSARCVTCKRSPCRC